MKGLDDDSNINDYIDVIDDIDFRLAARPCKVEEEVEWGA